jgi:rubrerythrin
MTREEARNELILWRNRNSDNGYHYKFVEALTIAIKALEQEPKTVLYSGDGYADGYMVYDMAECPTCGYEYEDGDKDWGLSFCPNCGQKLNWESEEV